MEGLVVLYSCFVCIYCKDTIDAASSNYKMALWALLALYSLRLQMENGLTSYN